MLQHVSVMSLVLGLSQEAMMNAINVLVIVTVDLMLSVDVVTSVEPATGTLIAPTVRPCVVTCKIKHFAKHSRKYFRAVDYPRLHRGCQNVVFFILHVVTAYLQRVFSMLKHLQNIC